VGTGVQLGIGVVVLGTGIVVLGTGVVVLGTGIEMLCKVVVVLGTGVVVLGAGMPSVCSSSASSTAVSKYHETRICILAMIVGLCYALVRNTLC